MSWRDQEGAVAVIVALFITFVAIAVISLTTDLGSLRQSKRALVTDTDAAALAGAVALAEDWRETEVCTEEVGTSQAITVLGENNPNDEVVLTDAGCRIDGASFTGFVRMQADQPSPEFFSGDGDLTARGTTTATFQLTLADGEGLAICTHIFGGTPGRPLSQFEVPGTDLVAIPYFKQEETMEYLVGTSCGRGWNAATIIPAAWGWLDNPCELGVEGTWCPSDPGNNTIQSWRPGSEPIRFPIFADARGQGRNGELLIVGHVQATVAGTCRVTGSAPFDPQDCSPTPNPSFNGNPQFILLREVEAFYYSQPDVRMFGDADYSVCDVDATGRFCP
jgi:hypothetical protein